MSEITIRTLAEDEWEQYRDMRLRALRESPDAFVADVETEEQYDEQLWRDRMNRSTRLLIRKGSESVGIASLRMDEALFDDAAELFSLWVTPELRGEGMAAKLVVAASEATRCDPPACTWVGITAPSMIIAGTNCVRSRGLRQLEPAGICTTV